MDPAPSHGLPQTLPSTHDQSAYTDTSASTIESSTAATTTNYTSPGTPQDQVARHMITNFDVASLNSKLQGIALTNRGHSDTPGAAVPPPASVTSEPISSLDDDVNPDIVAKYAQSSIDGLLTASMLQDIWGLVYLVWSQKQISRQKLEGVFVRILNKLMDQYRHIQRAAETKFDNAQKEAETKFDNAQKEAETKFENAQKMAETKFDNAQKAAETKFDNAQKAAETKFNHAQKEAETKFDNAQKAAETKFDNVEKAATMKYKNLETSWKARLEAAHTQLKTSEMKIQASETRIEDLTKAGNASEARIEDLLKFIHNLEYSAARLQSANLHGETVLRAIKGTPTTRAQAWDSEKLEPIPHPKFKEEFVVNTTEKTMLNTHILGITRIPAKSKETDYYAPMIACLASALDHDVCKVMNTHKSYYLAGGAPDISLSVPGTSTPQTACMYGFIEVKVPSANLGTSQYLGQVKDYLYRLMAVQQQRTHFWGFLSDGTEYILVEVIVQPNGSNLQWRYYVTMDIYQTIQYIREHIHTPGLGPEALLFDDSLGDARELISHSDKWQLAEFINPLDEKKSTMVVKLCREKPRYYHKNELHILREIKKSSERSSMKAPNTLSKLVWDPAWNPSEPAVYEFKDRVQFGISPVGKRFDLSSFNSRLSFSTALNGLLDALEWLHTVPKVIHRDVRIDNVIMVNDLLVLIDFDSSVQLSSSNGFSAPITYSGGLVCLPPCVVTQALETHRTVTEVEYTPEPAHDYCAFLLLIFALLFPSQYFPFRVANLHDEAKREEYLKELQEMHTHLEGCLTFGQWWAHATGGHVTNLRGICNLLPWPQRDRKC